jgi:hypothetical protein
MAQDQPRKTTLSGFIEALYKDWGDLRKEKELEWQEDLDNFLAKDETSKWKKKDKVKKKAEDSWKSSVFVRVVKEKVVMSYTFLNDLVLQGGQIPFMLKPNTESYEPEEVEQAELQSNDMQDKIRDQFNECKAERQFMKGTFSMSLYGETWVKSPLFKEVEKKRWKRSYPEGFDGYEDMARFDQEVFVESKPCIEYKSVWNMFSDPEYEDPQRGRGIIERDYISAFDLRMMQGKPGWSDEAIEKVISEDINRTRPSGDTSSKTPHLREINNPDRTILYLEFWGRVPRKYLEEFPQDIQVSISSSAKDQHNLDMAEKLGDDIEVTVIICNETVCRVLLNETGKRPYRHCKFEHLLDEVHGIGTARNVVDAQQIINGAYRNIIDNIALSGNVIIGVDEDSLVSGNQNKKELFPGKQFRFKQGTDVSKAMGSITIQNVAAQLIELLTIAKQHADEESLIPRIMQGDLAPKKKPDTLGEINLLFQNAGKYMGQVVKNIDEDYLEPVVEDFYDYNMNNPEFQGIQGDYTVHALGFNSFQSKVIKMQSLKSFLEIIMLNEMLTSEAKLRPILEEIAKALDLDPDQVLYTEEEKQDMQELQEAAQAEEFERQLQLVRAQAETEAEVEVQAEDEKGDNELQRELILEDKKSENKIEEIEAKGEVDIAKAKVDSKVRSIENGREIQKKRLQEKSKATKPKAKAKTATKTKAKKRATG